MDQFRRDGYAVVRSVIAADTARLATRYALLQRNWPGYYTREDTFRAANGRYADALSESLLLTVQSKVEQATGLTLLPCYSFLRIYTKGAILQKHTDRPSCEISTSLTLGFQADALWPLCAQSRGEDHAVELAPGDMLVYRGADLVHWRPVFAGEYWVQTFLHYVDAHGQYTDFKFDGRERIGPFDKLTMQRKFQRPASATPGDLGTPAPGEGPCPCGSGLRFRDCHGRSSH
ncbi:MAG: YecA family protein [Gammaproteobacteria bacterium]